MGHTTGVGGSFFLERVVVVAVTATGWL
jgi:hypothetical protein